MSAPNFTEWRPFVHETESAYWNVLFVRPCGNVKTSTPTGLEGSIGSSPVGNVTERNAWTSPGEVSMPTTDSFSKRNGLAGYSGKFSSVRPYEKRAWLKSVGLSAVSRMSERLCVVVSELIVERMARLTDGRIR